EPPGPNGLADGTTPGRIQHRAVGSSYYPGAVHSGAFSLYWSAAEPASRARASVGQERAPARGGGYRGRKARSWRTVPAPSGIDFYFAELSVVQRNGSPRRSFHGLAGPGLQPAAGDS